MNYLPSDTAPEGVAVMTKIDDAQGFRNEQIMVRQGNLWFVGETYVYYRPTHWRPLTAREQMERRHEHERQMMRREEMYQATLGEE